MRNHQTLIAAVLLTCAHLSGCSDPTGPDVDQYVVDSVRYACGDWFPQAPSKERALLDVHFGRRSSDDPDDRPREASLDRVRELGGEVVHSYHLAMARVILDVNRVPELSANYVDGVSDAPLVGAEVLVSIPVPLTSADHAFLAQIGARDVREQGFFVVAWVPDRSLPDLRAYPGVGFVEPNGVLCADRMKGS